jgi:hypothetical protein
MRTPKWTELKKQVFSRAGGVCERCHVAQAVHCLHVVWDRFGGSEQLEDLMAVCRACYLSSQPWFREQQREKKRQQDEQKRQEAVTPAGHSYSETDGLVWALGSYVERKGRETDRVYRLG